MTHCVGNAEEAFNKISNRDLSSQYHPAAKGEGERGATGATAAMSRTQITNKLLPITPLLVLLIIPLLASPITGSDLMAPGETVSLAIGTYSSPSTSVRASDDNFFSTYNMHGRVQCTVNGELVCILDGSAERRIFWIQGTDGQVRGSEERSDKLTTPS